MSVYTVSQINDYIKNMFTQDYFLHSVVVSGEVSNLKYHSSGHVFFSMKDESSILPAVMYRGNALKMKTKLKDGDSIEARGYVSFYEKSGVCQLYVQSVSMAGEGAQHEELQRLIAKLEEKGMFAPMYKQKIPKYSFRIGVVTSPTGSVIHDIRQVAARRNPGVEIILQPAKVQGEGAARSIIEGIEELSAQGVDVMIIGRGGGSDEDLSAFNNEELARTIFDCPIPIVSAVGHGDDESITDMVADAHAPTPSAAAEMTVFAFDDFVREVNMCAISLERLMNKHIDAGRAQLRQRALRMDSLSPQSKLKLLRLGHSGRAEKLDSLMRRHIDREKNRLLVHIEKYKGLSPIERIGHGYAAVQSEKGERITKAMSIKAGDTLKLTMRDGTVTAKALDVAKRD